MKKLVRIALILALAAVAPASWADNLTGINRFLCSAGNVTACDEDGECESGPAYLYNIPMFVEIDVAQKRIGTTKGSAENRTTEIKTQRREDGGILLQGYEKGNAFSYVIDEKTGMLSASVTGNGFSVAFFDVCTPLPRTK